MSAETYIRELSIATEVMPSSAGSTNPDAHSRIVGQWSQHLVKTTARGARVRAEGSLGLLGGAPGKSFQDELESAASHDQVVDTDSTLPPAQLPPLPDRLAAAVDAGSLLSFVDGISADERQDVLDSIQLAARGASAAHHRFNDTEAWYSKYIEILEQLGWTSEQFAFTKYAQSKGELRMDQAALAIIAAIATQNQLAVLKEALGALKELAQDDGTIRLFDFHASAQTSGNFQLGAVQKSDNGSLSMAVGAFHFQSDDQRRRFLFFGWGALAVQFWSAAQKMTFNRQHYAQLRSLVQSKLGTSTQQYLSDLPLA